jgi:hypothetical protein
MTTFEEEEEERKRRVVRKARRSDGLSTRDLSWSHDEA